MSTTLNLAPKGGDMPEWAIYAATCAGVDLGNATYNPAGEFVEFSLDYSTGLEREPGRDGPDLYVMVSDFGAVYLRDVAETVLARCMDNRQTWIDNQVEAFLFAAKLIKLLNGADDAISPVEVTA